MSAPIDPSILPQTAAISANGRLSIGGCDLETLAEEFGTPLFVYDEIDIRSRCAAYAEAFGADAVFYASKAFSGRAISEIIHDEGLSIDVSTAGEYHAARRGGFAPSRVLFHGNNKSNDELAYALHDGVGRIVVDSFDELDRIETLVGSGLPCPRLLVRVTPGIEAHTHAYIETGIEDTKFGFQLRSGAAHHAVERIANNPALHFVGLHCHIGSQIFSPDPFVRVTAIMAELVEDLTAATGAIVTELNLGGGLGIAYTATDNPMSIAEYADVLRAGIVDAWADRDLGSPPRLFVEPGRSIVGTAGCTLYRVGTIKHVDGARTYVSVDGGMSDNIRHALYGAAYEAFVPSRANDSRAAQATIAGKHCEQGDLIATDTPVPADLRIGDILCTPVTGAYGYALASGYNEVPRPAVVIVRDGKARIAFRRETTADLARLEP
ncbi:MAG: diaminopimelate decarboxylase [Acidimicrobiia bacterium]